MTNLQTQIAKWTIAYKWHKLPTGAMVFVTGKLQFLTYVNGVLVGSGLLSEEMADYLYNL